MKSFSIYLLKKGITSENCFKEDADTGELTKAQALPENSKLFIFDNQPRPPWWKEYFDIDKPLNQMLKGAILILPVKDRYFCITFGHVAHKLLDSAYEYDFGMQVTLNCLDPKKIKNTDTLTPASSMRQRTQTSSDTDLANFGFDRHSTIIKSLTGKVREEYKDIIQSVTGAAHLRVGTKVTSKGLPKFCGDLLRLYLSEKYKDDFPNLLNIVPMRDPAIIERLDAKLIKAIHENGDVGLIIPEIIDYQEAVSVKFKGLRGNYICNDIQFSEYQSYLEKRDFTLQKVDIETLKRHGMDLCDQEGTLKGKSFSIYKSIVFDTQLKEDTATYHLTDGGWHRIDGDYVNTLSKYLDPLFEEQSLPDYTQLNEKSYNEHVSKTNELRICLDRKDISPKAQTSIEPCDIVELDGESISLIHVKISTQSSLLSHLFNQGIVSYELLLLNEEARKKLSDLISGRTADFEKWQKALDNKNFSVCYAIVTHKEPTEKSKNLPLFSRISLFQVMKDLEIRGVKRRVQFVHTKKNDAKLSNTPI